jgi:hypothetical protein
MADFLLRLANILEAADRLIRLAPVEIILVLDQVRQSMLRVLELVEDVATG